MTETLTTENPNHGFYGSINRAEEGLDTARIWEAMSEALAEAADAFDGYGPEGVRDFLDSRDGRHLADAFIDRLQRARAETTRDACRGLVAELNRARISRETEREYGIPEGLPYATGWVAHYAIMAEHEAETD